MQANYPHSCVLHLLQRGRQPTNHAHRYVLRCTCGRLSSSRRNVHRSVTGQNHAIDSGTITRSQDRSEVARVCYAIHSNQQLRLLRSQISNEISQVDIWNGCCHRQHTLRCLASGFALYFLSSNTTNRNTLIICQLDDVVDYFVVIDVI